VPIWIQPNIPQKDPQKSGELTTFLSLKQTVARLRRHLSGRFQPLLSPHDVASLGLADWVKAVQENQHLRHGRKRVAHQIVYAPPSEMEATVPDRSSNPFELFYQSELIALIEKNLTPDERPYWEALLAGDRPRHVAARLGIDRKLASKKMKKLEAKIVSLIFGPSRLA